MTELNIQLLHKEALPAKIAYNIVDPWFVEAMQK